MEPTCDVAIKSDLGEKEIEEGEVMKKKKLKKRDGDEGEDEDEDGK